MPWRQDPLLVWYVLEKGCTQSLVVSHRYWVVPLISTRVSGHWSSYWQPSAIMKCTVHFWWACTGVPSGVLYHSQTSVRSMMFLTQSGTTKERTTCSVHLCTGHFHAVCNLCVKHNVWFKCLLHKLDPLEIFLNLGIIANPFDYIHPHLAICCAALYVVPLYMTVLYVVPLCVTVSENKLFCFNQIPAEKCANWHCE